MLRFGMSPVEITKEIWSLVQSKSIDYEEFKRLLREYASARNEQLRWAGNGYENMNIEERKRFDKEK